MESVTLRTEMYTPTHSATVLAKRPPTATANYDLKNNRRTGYINISIIKNQFFYLSDKNR